MVRILQKQDLVEQGKNKKVKLIKNYLKFSLWIMQLVCCMVHRSYVHVKYMDEGQKYVFLNSSSMDAIRFKILTYNIKQNHCQIYVQKAKKNIFQVLLFHWLIMCHASETSNLKIIYLYLICQLLSVNLIINCCNCW